MIRYLLAAVSCCPALVVGKQVLSSEVFFALFTNRPLSLSNQTCSRSSISNIHCVARFPLCCTISTLSHDFHSVARFPLCRTNCDSRRKCDTMRHNTTCGTTLRILGSIGCVSEKWKYLPHFEIARSQRRQVLGFLHTTKSAASSAPMLCSLVTRCRLLSKNRPVGQA